jgi:transposase
MDIQTLFRMALQINEPWFISDIDFSADKKRLNIHLDFNSGSTFHYESLTEGINGDFKAYDTVIKKWRHLNFFEHECYLIARIPRIDLRNGKVRQIKAPWEGISSGFTLLFESLILQLAKAMTPHQLAMLIKENDHKIWKMLNYYVDNTLLLNDYSDVEIIGIDETSQKKKHNYISLFVDLKEKKTIFIAQGKDNQTVKAFVEDLKSHNGDIENITDVSCDMSPAFIKGVKENLPNATITFDKFHIVKVINEGVDEVRREEVKQNPLLKGQRYVLLKNNKNLSKKQHTQLKSLSLKKLNLKSIRALHIRESFQNIYLATTEDEFNVLLKKWYFWATHSRLEPMKKAAKTIKNHWDGVIAWKKSQINNGILEGLNSIIQAAKAKSRGFRTFKNFRIIAFLLTGKLNFGILNKHLLPT